MKPFVFAVTLVLALLGARAAGALELSARLDPSICGDVNVSGALTTSDALAVLRASVGQEVQLSCGASPAMDFGYLPEILPTSAFAKDYLLGSAVSIPYPVTVTSLGVVSKKAGPHARIALYTDNGGAPDALVVASPQFTLLKGRQSISVAQTPIGAGSYWVMAVFEEDADLAGDDEASESLIRFRVLPYSDPLPSTFGPSSAYTGSHINHYVKAIP